MKNELIILTFFILTFFSFTNSINDKKVCFVGKTKFKEGVEKSDTTFSASIYEIQDTTFILKARYKAFDYKFCADYNKEYIIRLAKSNYVSKEIYISTKNINLTRWNEGFTDIPFSITLFKANPDSVYKFEQPMCAYVYDNSVDDFDFKTNYKRIYK